MHSDCAESGQITGVREDAGHSRYASYNDGVSVATLGRFGLMGESTVSGTKYSYLPVASDDNVGPDL